MTFFEDVWLSVEKELGKYYTDDIIKTRFCKIRVAAIENEYAILFTDAEENLEFLRSQTGKIDRAFADAFGEFRVIYIHSSNEENRLATLKKDAEFDLVYPVGAGSVYDRPSPRSLMKPDEGMEVNIDADDYLRKYLKKSAGPRSEEQDEELKKNSPPPEPLFKGTGNDYTFDNFIVSSSNKFAYNASIAVSTNPSTAWNPLFIYGPSGLGKTHLLYAIANQLAANFPNMKIVYDRGEDFTIELVASLKVKDGPEKFRNKFRKLDVLLIDDIQFIAGKEGVQEEFFHTFNSLYEDKKQIILTSDKPPRDIAFLQDRLKTRFEMGLTADVQPPDYELRAAVITSKAHDYGIEIPPDVVTFLAENLNKNIRQIEGSLKRLAAKSTLYGTAVTLDMAKRSLSDMMSVDTSPKVMIEKIFTAVSNKYGIGENEIKSKSRRREITNARHVVIYFIRKYTNYSLKQIAAIFGRDHSTILSSIEVTEGRISTEPLFEREISELDTEIKG